MSQKTVVLPAVVKISRARWRDAVSKISVLHVAQHGAAAHERSRLWHSVVGSSTAESGAWAIRFTCEVDGTMTTLASLRQDVTAMLFRVGDVMLNPPVRLATVFDRAVMDGAVWPAGMLALAVPPVLATTALNVLVPLLRRLAETLPAPSVLHHVPGSLIRALRVQIELDAPLLRPPSSAPEDLVTMYYDAVRGVRVAASRVQLVVTTTNGGETEQRASPATAARALSPRACTALSMLRVSGVGGLRAAVLPNGAVLLGDVDTWWAPAGMRTPPPATDVPLLAPRALPRYGALKRTAQRGDTLELNALPEWRIVPVSGTAPLCALLSTTTPVDAVLGAAAVGVCVAASVAPRDSGMVYAAGAVGAVPNAIMMEARRLDAAASAAAPDGVVAPHRVLVLTGTELALCTAARTLLASGAAVLPLKARLDETDFSDRVTVRATCERLRASKPADISNEVATAMRAIASPSIAPCAPTTALAALCAAGITAPGVGVHSVVSSWAELGARIAAGAGFAPSVAALFPEPVASYVRVACAIAARPDHAPCVLDSAQHVRAFNVKFEDGAVKERAARLVAALYWLNYSEDGAGNAPREVFVAILLDGLVRFGLVAGTKNAYARGVPDKRVILLDYCFWYGETPLGSLTQAPARAIAKRSIADEEETVSRLTEAVVQRAHKRVRSGVKFANEVLLPLPHVARVPPIIPSMTMGAGVPYATASVADGAATWPIFDFEPAALKDVDDVFINELNAAAGAGLTTSDYMALV